MADETIPRTARVSPSKTSPQLFDIGTVVGARYEVMRVLGFGGMGVVYGVRDLNGDEDEIALKTVRHRLSATEASWLKVEFMMAAALRHPHVARVFDFGRTDRGLHYFTMEHVPGIGLGEAAQGGMSKASLDRFVELCRALAYVHSRGFTHNDVKPSNVIITHDVGAKLIDFGISSGLVRTRLSVLGTPGFTAPEVLADETHDHRADLYSLGAVLVELLVAGDSTADAAANGHNPIARLAACESASPWRHLTPIIERLCHPSPQERYRNAAEVIEAINHAEGTSYAYETDETRSGYVLSSRLIGRTSERARITDFIERRIGARDRTVLHVVRAPSGSGKTRLLREIRHQYQVSIVPVVHAQVRSVADTSFETALSILNQIQPLEAADDAPQEGGAVAIATRILEAVGDRPTLAMLDDFHWADVETVAVVQQLILRLEERSEIPLALVIAVRTDRLPDTHAARLLSWVDAAKRVENTVLSPLEREETAEVVASMLGLQSVPDDIAGHVHQNSRGVPMLIEAHTRTLLGDGVILSTAQGWSFETTTNRAAGPLAFQDLIARQSDLSRRLLAALSVLSRPTSVNVLTFMHQQEAMDAIVSALRGMEQSGLIAFNGKMVALSHSLVETAVFGTLTEDDEANLHRDAAAAIIAELGPAAVGHAQLIANHLAKSGDRERALRLAAEGADWRWSRGEMVDAAQLYQTALELADGHATPVATREWVGRLADAESKIGRYASAATRFETLLRASDLSALQRARFLYGLGVARLASGKVEQAGAALYDAQSALGFPESTGLRGVLSSAGRLVASLAQSRKALSARDRETHSLLCRIMCERFLVGGLTGAYVPPLPIGHMLVNARLGADPDDRAFADSFVAFGEAMMGRHDAAQSRLDQADADAAPADVTSWTRAVLSTQRGFVTYLAGDLAPAATHLSDAFRRFDRLSDPWWMTHAAGVNALIAVCRADFDQLERWAHYYDRDPRLAAVGDAAIRVEVFLLVSRIIKGVASADGLFDRFATLPRFERAYSHAVMGNALMITGDWQGCWAHLSASARIQKAMTPGWVVAARMPTPIDMFAPVDACVARVAHAQPNLLNQPSRGAKRALQRSDRISRIISPHRPFHLAMEGLRESRRGDLERATRRFDEALSLCERQGASLAHAVVLREHGCALMESNRIEEGRGRLAASVAEFESIGAFAAADCATALMSGAT